MILCPSLPAIIFIVSGWLNTHSRRAWHHKTPTTHLFKILIYYVQFIRNVSTIWQKPSQTFGTEKSAINIYIQHLKTTNERNLDGWLDDNNRNKQVFTSDHSSTSEWGDKLPTYIWLYHLKSDQGLLVFTYLLVWFGSCVHFLIIPTRLAPPGKIKQTPLVIYSNNLAQICFVIAG